MTNEQFTSARRTARIAGALYLAMMPFAMFSLYVRLAQIPQTTVGDAATAITNLSGMFGAAIITWLTSQAISVFLVVQLYKLLKPVNATHALLMLALALIGVPIVCGNEVHQLALLQMLGDPLSSSDEEMLSRVAFHLQMHAAGIDVAHIFWGLWLLPLGWLVFRSGFLPRWIGLLLLIAGLGYLFDFFMSVVLSFKPTPVTTYTFIGELLFPLWLLIRGVNMRHPQKEAAAAS